MNDRGAARALLIAATMVAAGFAGAADTRPTPPPSMVARPPTGGSMGFAPNLSVGAVWIGSGTGDRFAPLGRNPRLGETVSLVCRVAMTGSPEAGWRLAWVVDGVRTCGEGRYAVTQRDCLYPWPMDTGTEVFVDWVGHALGSHTFSCVVDAGGAVKESSETDNSKAVTFSVAEPLHGLSRERLPVTRAPLGPSLRLRH